MTLALETEQRQAGLTACLAVTPMLIRDPAIVFQSFLPKFSTVSPALLFSSPRFFFRLSGPYNYLGAVTASSLRTCSPLTYVFSVRAGQLETASAIIVITIVLNLCFVFQVLLDVQARC